MRRTRKPFSTVGALITGSEDDAINLAGGPDTLTSGDAANAATVANAETIVGGIGADTVTMSAPLVIAMSLRPHGRHAGTGDDTPATTRSTSHPCDRGTSCDPRRSGRMTRPTRLLFGLLAGMALPWVAFAQNPQPAAPHETHPSVAPPNAPSPPPEKIAPADRTPRGRQSEQQAVAQQGTLQPPSVDPGIHVPVPPQSQGTMPVIPPPGAPGGDRTVVPK